MADFLRHRREALRPEDVGLSPVHAGGPEVYGVRRSRPSP